jgi:pheromone shutdown protein TraB
VGGGLLVCCMFGFCKVPPTLQPTATTPSPALIQTKFKRCLTHTATDRLGVQPGAEFRAAALAADAAGASLVLCDRPIEITLQRAWDALTWRRRADLLADLLLAGMSREAQVPALACLLACQCGVLPVRCSATALLTQTSRPCTPVDAQALDAAAVERLRSDDAVSALFSELAARYPELVGPLVTERDMYLAWSLKRSKAVNGATAVVGVVGKGHLRGVVHALRRGSGSGNGSTLRFSDLVGGKNSSRGRAQAAAAVVQRLVVEVALGAGLYAAWAATHGGGSSSSVAPLG